MATAYQNSIRTAKRHLRIARSKRQLAYNIDMGFHGQADLVVQGIYRWYPSPGHHGWLVEADTLVLDIAIG